MWASKFLSSFDSYVSYFKEEKNDRLKDSNVAH